MPPHRALHMSETDDDRTIIVMWHISRFGHERSPSPGIKLLQLCIITSLER